MNAHITILTLLLLFVGALAHPLNGDTGAVTHGGPFRVPVRRQDPAVAVTGNSSAVFDPAPVVRPIRALTNLRNRLIHVILPNQ